MTDTHPAPAARQCVWPGCPRPAATRRGATGPLPRYCGVDGHTPEGARQAKRVAMQRAATAAASAATTGRLLGDGLPPEGRIRQLVAAWLEALQSQATAQAASATLLADAVYELARWEDPELVEARIAEMQAQIEWAHAEMARKDAALAAAERTAQAQSHELALAQAARLAAEQLAEEHSAHRQAAENDARTARDAATAAAAELDTARQQATAARDAAATTATALAVAEAGTTELRNRITDLTEQLKAAHGQIGRLRGTPRTRRATQRSTARPGRAEPAGGDETG